MTAEFHLSRPARILEPNRRRNCLWAWRAVVIRSCHAGGSLRAVGGIGGIDVFGGASGDAQALSRVSFRVYLLQGLPRAEEAGHIHRHDP